MASSSSSPEISASISAESRARFSYKDATHDEVLEDLTSRFILNLPDEELTSVERVCFQVEQAHWFYEDFIREENPKFPSLPLRKFSAMLFNSCPVLHHWANDHEQAFNNFMHYKTLVPVCGAIMLNETWDKCVLVKGWKSSSGWGFPKGKINETEPPPTCAVREVLEETGYNLAGKINNDNKIETTINGQKVSLFIVPDIPEDFPFKTKTRKEISKIEWFRLTDLPSWKRSKQTPGKFYLITPFIGALKNFVNGNKPRRNALKATKSKVFPSLAANNAMKTVASTSTDLDAMQESSSQSSSLDNGDPQTPSPHYIESAPAFAPYIQDDQTMPVFSTESLDPHFARLLSGLKMSAAAASAEQKDKNIAPNVHIPALGGAVENDVVFATPLDTEPSPISSSFHVSSVADAPTERRISMETDHSTLASDSTVAFSSDLKSIPPCILSHHRSPPKSNPPPPSLPLCGSSQTNQRHSSSPSYDAPPSLNTSALSPRSTAARKTLTADISPYLTRPPEIPVSAKRLQQLALLESVADESARMTPLLVNRPPLPLNMHPSSLSVPSSHMMSQRINQPPVPPSQHNISSYNSMHNYSNPMTMQYDPFLVRSRTSQAIRRFPMHSPPGSMSMNQNQLLALINGPQTAPVLAPLRPYPHYPQQHFPSVYPAAAFNPHNISPYAPQPGRQGLPTSHLSSGPRPFSSAQVGVPPVPETSQKLQSPSGNTLLSIFNSNKPASQLLSATTGPQMTHA